jgi:hypothetical protein
MVELAFQFAVLPSAWRLGYGHVRLPSEGELPAADAFSFWLIFFGIQLTFFYSETYS